jgi:glucosyl-3-phosphoglycerate synthase
MIRKGRMINKKKAKILIPLIAGQKNQNIINISEWFSKLTPIIILGIVLVDHEVSLSTAVHEVKKLRDYLKKNLKDASSQIRTEVIVTHDSWEEITGYLKNNPRIETLILEWPHQINELGLKVHQLINNPPVDIRVVKGQFNRVPTSVFIPVRGGPQAEEAVRMSLRLGKAFGTQITLQRVFASQEQADIKDRGFRGLERVINELPEIDVEKIISDNISEAILSSSCKRDLVILGTDQQTGEDDTSFGFITDQVLKNCPADVIAIKTKRSAKPESPEFSSQAISILVDKWFAENTFESDEFSDIENLLHLKEQSGLSISLALPSLNEEETIGNVISIAKTNFMNKFPLLDEIILVDSGSEDHTREIAKDLGIDVYLNQEVLKNYGFRMGKGEVLWKSLYLTSGDIIFWLDTDVKNFSPKYIYGILGPLLTNEKIKFVKAFYKRPISGKKGVIRLGEGGRVTELTARPLLNLFYPELSGIIQPLSGEYGGRREVLENLTFTSGYGVETSLLIDLVENYHLNSIGQVNLEMRVHRNQPLQELSKMSFAIIQTILSKLSRRFDTNLIEEINSTMNTIQYEGDRFFLKVNEISELERPPMVSISEYREKFGKK